MAYNTDPRLLNAIRQAPADLQPELLATTWVETGGRLDPVGDNGQSFGPYQEYTGGRGAGLTPAQRRDPVASTQRAVKEFSQYKAKGLSGGALAAAAQRPANSGAYASKVDSLLAEARSVLGGAAPRSQQGSLSTVLPSGQQTTTTSTPDIGSSLALGIANRSRGQSLTSAVYNSVISAAMSSVGQSAVSPERGYQQNPTGVAPSAGNSNVVNAAKRNLGLPYSWGGGTTSGPSKGFGRGANTVGFDCSSLVQNAWAQAGVQLPRTTYEQIKVGRALDTKSPNSWPPGTLLFPHTGHVQMYVGNGKVIEAPRTGGHVQIVPMKSSYIAARWPGK